MDFAMRRIFQPFAVPAIMLFAPLSQAADGDWFNFNQPGYATPEASGLARLEAADESSYIVYRHSEGDENALRGKLGVRYWFSSGADRIFYFKFATEFDFYFPEQRTSSPVIGRTYNPGLAWRITDPGLGFKWFEFAVEHRSNGQATDVSSANPTGVAAAQAAYAANDHRFFDSVSRSNNFATLSGLYAVTRRSAFAVSTKLYFHKYDENEITWGPMAGSGIRISDYDRYSLRYLYNERGLPAVDLEWMIGDRGAGKSSWNLGITLGEIFALPIYVRVHRGPMNTLANYTLDQTMYGLGVVFRPWK